MAVSKRLRYEILRRDNHTCRYCGLAAPEVKLTIDHVVPSTLGGNDDPSNLVAACKDCNAGKSASSPDAELVADVDQRAIRWGKAMQVAVERRAAELAVDRENTAWFNDAWTNWTRGDATMPLDPNWKNSVLRFMASGLDREFLVDAVATAMGKDRLLDRDRWRYFCGICWREMDRLLELASEVADSNEPVVEVKIPERWVHAMRFLSYASDYMDCALEAVDVPYEVRERITTGLWRASEEAEEVFRAGQPGEWDTVEDRADETFSSVSAWYENQIQLYGASVRRVPDGS